MSELDIALLPEAQTAKAWPFEEARRLIARLDKIPGGKDKVALFETGYGPSGLPHIGTFGEVARTSMVRHAFETLTGRETRLVCFSDDMDGLRKVPTNVPNQEELSKHLDKPLTNVPDPFGKFESFAHHNNAMLRDFLDRFGFQYEFFSATECYKAGLFDATLLRMLAVYDKVLSIILPTLGPDRQATYSPFLPVCPRTGKVLQVPMIARDVNAGTVTYVDPETGEKVETPVTGGRVKCQWKADWAMRWTALGVDYEMAGKDLDRFGDTVVANLPGAGRHAARGLQLRAVPRRERPKDLEVQGQRPHHRRMADLCVAAEPVALHVPEAEDGEAALLRRYPARGG